jgi:hypothetical protein
MLAPAGLGCQAYNDKLDSDGMRQPSPLGRGWVAAGVFISRSGPGEGSLAPSWVVHPWREGVKEPRICHPEPVRFAQGKLREGSLQLFVSR